jgi:hypothetical protein
VLFPCIHQVTDGGDIKKVTTSVGATAVRLLKYNGQQFALMGGTLKTIVDADSKVHCAGTVVVYVQPLSVND